MVDLAESEWLPQFQTPITSFLDLFSSGWNITFVSLVPNVIGHDVLLTATSEFQVGGKKHVRFSRAFMPYNVWCISYREGGVGSRELINCLACTTNTT